MAFKRPLAALPDTALIPATRVLQSFPRAIVNNNERLLPSRYVLIFCTMAALMIGVSTMRKTCKHGSMVLALVAMSFITVQAQQDAKASHGSHSSSAATAAALAPGNAREALDQSMGRMHDDMMRGIAHDDADVAFAAGMLAHHDGAVQMARIQLQYGKDPAMRQLAEEVIRAQEGEMILLKDWLAKRGLGADGHPVEQANSHAGH